MLDSILSRYKDLGLLILRIGIGLMFIGHGLPKLKAGPQLWSNLGTAISNIGINFGFTFWGFMAAFSEAVGGTLIIIGLFFRPASLLLAITMLTAAAMLISKGIDFTGFSHPSELFIVFLSLIFIGPGKYSIDHRIQKKA